MFYKKTGLPEENEIVICIVKKILYHSVFVEMEEYKNLEGMIHISEIAPGRIRNLRDYVKEGKRIVCKILRVHKEKKHFDLSLRRVSLAARKNKLSEFKQEQKAEKLLESVAKKLKIKLEDIYKKLGDKIIEKYGSLTNCFKDIILNKTDLKEFKPDKIIKAIVKLVKEKIKPTEVKVERILTLINTNSDGILKIKKSIKKAVEFAKQKDYKVKIIYLGAPKYNLTVKSSDYKTAEKNMQEIIDLILKENKDLGGQGEWQKKS